MRQFAKQFWINGQPMLAPDADVTATYKDLDCADGGRDEAGVMHRIVLRPKVGVWTFCYSRLSEEERRYMERLFPRRGGLSLYPSKPASRARGSDLPGLPAGMYDALSQCAPRPMARLQI